MPFTKSAGFCAGAGNTPYTFALVERIRTMDPITSEAIFILGLYPDASSLTPILRINGGRLSVTGAVFQAYLTSAALSVAVTNGKNAYHVVDQIISDYLAAEAAYSTAYSAAVAGGATPTAAAQTANGSLTAAQQALLVPGACWIANDFGGATMFTGAAQS